MSEVTQTLIDDAQAHSQSESRITARDLRQRFLALLYVARIVEL
ncbi:PTS family sugar transport protein component IID [Salmonella enterica subsp. enterica]|uniref:PTS family sugar transport protein component IID n=1 Tax=Salmonella enterica I TaxID=59201 RepID=A0A3S4IN89_SALET|nr:PTS family sugar transport protein component IID [Salmonella enterica subsp. enterica]